MIMFLHHNTVCYVILWSSLILPSGSQQCSNDTQLAQNRIVSVFDMVMPRSDALTTGQLVSVTDAAIQNDLENVMQSCNITSIWTSGELKAQPDSWTWLTPCCGPSPINLNISNQGCYIESFVNVARRDLPYNSMLPSTNVSVTNCIAECESKNYTYAGVQNGDRCYCGNSYGKYGQSSITCDLPCRGDSTQQCGYYNANQIYETNGQWGVWTAGQPNNYNNFQYCAFLETDGVSSYSLSDEDCAARQFNFVCETQLNGSSLCSSMSGFDKMTKYQSSVYSKCLYISSTASGWYQALQTCRMSGGQLLTILDENFYTFIEGWFKSSSAPQKLWVGLYRPLFQWTAGDSLNYTNFASGEPQNIQNKYIIINGNFSYQWQTVPESQYFKVITETYLTTEAPTTTTTTATITNTTPATTVTTAAPNTPSIAQATPSVGQSAQDGLKAGTIAAIVVACVVVLVLIVLIIVGVIYVTHYRINSTYRVKQTTPSHLS